MTEKKGSTECFVMVNGKKQDASIHEQILDSPEARKKLLASSIALAIELGMSPEMAKRLYHA